MAAAAYALLIITGVQLPGPLGALAVFVGIVGLATLRPGG